MFVTNWISTTKIQKISEITNFFRHYFLSRTEVFLVIKIPMDSCNTDRRVRFWRDRLVVDVDEGQITYVMLFLKLNSKSLTSRAKIGS